MICSEADEHIAPYLDNELDHVIVLKLKQHLITCAQCQASYLEQKQAKGLVSTRFSSESAPTTLKERIQQAIRVAPSYWA